MLLLIESGDITSNINMPDNSALSDDSLENDCSA